MAKRRARSDHQRTSRIKHHLAATKAGAQPGTILYVGKEDIRDTDASLIEFGPQAGDLKQTIFTDSHPELPEVTPDRTLWVNVHGLANAELLQAIGHHFSLHPLVMEDIFNTQQRSKVEIYSGYLFITARLVRVDAEAVIQSEQISIVLGRGFVLTFQEEASGTFKGIRDNLQNEQSQLRRLGADYLVYSLMDKLVDRYFAVLESLGERMEEIEDDLEMDARPKCLTDVQTLRRALLAVKRGLWPLREMVNTLQRDEPDFFRSETQLYLRDVYDHTVQLIESTEALRDLVGSLQDTYLSLQGHRMNQQMRVLTVITTIFMPLTLIAGIYGMNFEHIPELHWRYGYFYCVGLMAMIALSLAGYFKFRKWF
ncbi:magnesium/cobalt transporter CorA [Silvimonas sp. JCM 19000]